MNLVVDASVVAALYFSDERPPVIFEVAEAMIRAETFAPTLFWYEIRAAALKKEHRKILTAAAVDEALRQIRELAITRIDMSNDTETLKFARRHGLSFYDASYLALAVAQRAKLFTFDKRLAAAAATEGVLFAS